MYVKCHIYVVRLNEKLSGFTLDLCCNNDAVGCNSVEKERWCDECDWQPHVIQREFIGSATSPSALFEAW